MHLSAGPAAQNGFRRHPSEASFFNCLASFLMDFLWGMFKSLSTDYIALSILINKMGAIYEFILGVLLSISCFFVDFLWLNIIENSVWHF